VKLLAEVSLLLRQREVPHAVIGAAALAVLGVARSTQDLDLLTTDRRVLVGSFWDPLARGGAKVEVHVGDIQDPIAGVVRITREGDRPVDLLVGEAPWQGRVLAEAIPHDLGGASVPVANAVGLVLLKLYAGGPQDMWDIEQVLGLEPSPAALLAAVDGRVGELPGRCRRLWRRAAATRRRG
jgi:hypothetical protein